MMQYLEQLMNRVKLLFGTGAVTMAKTNTVQVKYATNITNDRIQRPHNYGFMSRPLVGAKAYTAFFGGDTSEGFALCVEDKRHQMELQPGEVAMIDHLGNLIHFTASGIKINTPNTLTIDAQNTIINSPMQINGHITNSGGIEIDGLEFGRHGHQENGDGGGITNTPIKV